MKFPGFRGDFLRQPPSQLTPDLARINPETYKKELIDVLKRNTEQSGKMWEHLCSKGICAHDRLIIDPDYDEGSSLGGIVTLGAQSWGSVEMEWLTYPRKDFTADKEIMYRFSHEISHIMFTDFKHFQTTKLLNEIIELREATQLGYSYLGSQNIYSESGPYAPGSEDISELINRYLIDPRYLNDYLQILASDDTNSMRYKKEAKLVNITSSSAGNIFNIIQDCVRSRLRT